MRKRLRVANILCLLALCLDAIGAEKILLLRPMGINFEETAKGLQIELGSGFQIVELLVSPDMEEGKIVKEIVKTRPKVLVLLDNNAILLYSKIQKHWQDSIPFPPSIALMAVRVDKAIAEMKRVTGIFYEVPGVTSILNLRSLIVDPMQKVGVLFRPSMQDFVLESARWCKSENIELVAFEVPENTRDIALAVRNGVRRLRIQDQVDALWVLNDNYFLTPEIISEGWLPALERFQKPVLVGVENLISSKVTFGSFATLPDHFGLGVQVAGIIHRLEEVNWRMEVKPMVQQPLAIIKMISLKQARKVSEVKESALLEIDKVMP